MRHVSSLLSAAIVIMLIVACAPTPAAPVSQPASSASASSPAAAAPIKVGIMSSITGPTANLSNEMVDGAQLAVDLVNQAGGIGGRKVETAVCDDKYDAATATVCMTKLVNEDKVIAIAGPSQSAGTLTLIPIAERNKIPVISFAVLSGNYVTNPPPWVFAMYPAAPLETQALLNYITSKTTAKKIGVIHDSVPYATGMRDAFLPIAKAAGLDIVAVEQYQSTDTDFRPQLTKVQSAGADLIVELGGQTPPAIIAKQRYEMGIKAPMISASSVYGPGFDKFKEIAGAAATEGIVASLSTLDVYQTMPTSDPRTPVVQKFVAAFKAKYNREPVSYNGIAYDSMSLILESIKRAGPDPVKMRDALEAIQGFTGVTAVVSFSPKNHIGPTPESLVMTVVKDGKIVPLQ